MSKKKALCVGINYVGTEYELRGCINDADDWASKLSKHGFDASVLAEKQATRDGILSGLSLLVKGLQPGDTAALTYSGHGTWVPDRDGDEPDGRDEALCPVDMGDDGRNLIVDDELREIFNKIPAGAHLLFVSDSCHSGTVFRFFNGVGGKRRVRFIPPAHFLKDTALFSRMERAFGQPAPRRTNAAIPGVIQLSGCRDNEYSTDAEVDGRANGAMTYYALKAFEATARAKGTYHDAWKRLREHLPSWEYQQTPLLNAPASLKKLPVWA